MLLLLCRLSTFIGGFTAGLFAAVMTGKPRHIATWVSVLLSFPLLLDDKCSLHHLTLQPLKDDEVLLTPLLLTVSRDLGQG